MTSDGGGMSAMKAAVTTLKSIPDYILGSIPPSLHEEYKSEGKLVLFRCKECEYTSMSIGATMGHIEGHRGYTRFNIQLPFTKTSPGDFDRLLEMTEVVRVEEEAVIELSEVEQYD